MDLERYNSYVLMKFEERCGAHSELRPAAMYYVAFYIQLQHALRDAVEWQKMVDTIRTPEARQD